MTDRARTTLRVVSAGPLVSIQDTGRPGHLRHGVPTSGPMDRLAFAVANAVVGNPTGATGIEVSMAGCALRCEGGPLTIAVCGAGPAVSVDGSMESSSDDSWVVLTLRDGQRLTVRPTTWGSWSYVAVAGDLVADRWLGSTSTHTVSGRGGGLLRSGDVLAVAAPRAEPERDGAVEPLDRAGADDPVRVVLGPQEHRFEPVAIERVLSETFRASAAFDRMGLRLDGPSLPIAGALSIPSEAIIRGSVQVAGDGVPTVLLADHQTTGGYPKIATVIDADVDRVAQLRPGDEIRFLAVSPEEAVEAARDRARVAESLIAMAQRLDRGLVHRLRRHNLVDGVVSSDDEV